MLETYYLRLHCLLHQPLSVGLQLDDVFASHFTHNGKSYPALPAADKQVFLEKARSIVDYPKSVATDHAMCTVLRFDALCQGLSPQCTLAYSSIHSYYYCI